MGQINGNPVQTSCGLSLLMAVLTFLSVWGGVTLWLNAPDGPSMPPFNDTPRGALASLLLFWFPLLTGSGACLTGLVGLARGGLSLEGRRQAVTGIVLGLIPACLAIAWLGWALSN